MKTKKNHIKYTRKKRKTEYCNQYSEERKSRTEYHKIKFQPWDLSFQSLSFQIFKWRRERWKVVKCHSIFFPAFHFLCFEIFSEFLLKKDIIPSYLVKNRHENEPLYPHRCAAPCFIIFAKSCNNLISYFQQFYGRTFDSAYVYIGTYCSDRGT